MFTTERNNEDRQHSNRAIMKAELFGRDSRFGAFDE
jgi:hypothetical protein